MQNDCISLPKSCLSILWYMLRRAGSGCFSRMKRNFFKISTRRDISNPSSKVEAMLAVKHSFTNSLTRMMSAVDECLRAKSAINSHVLKCSSRNTLEMKSNVLPY